MRTRRVLGLLAVLVLPVPAWAKALPTEPFTVLTRESLRGGINLSEGWRYHPGDDASWASRSFDDRSWPLVSSRLGDSAAVPGGWPGIGWFRRSVALGPGLERVVAALYVEQMGASEVYFDGNLVASYGTPAASPREERAFFPRRFAGVVLEPGMEHLIAVRYSNATGNALSARMRGFTLYLFPVDRIAALVSRLALLGAGVSVIAGVFLAFFVLYLLLWVSRREHRENLWFALFSGFITANFLLNLWTSLAEEPRQALLALFALAATAVGFVLSGLALEHSFFRLRPSWWTWLVVAAGLGMLAWLATWTHVRPILVPQVYVLIGAAEMLRIALRATFRREQDAWIIAAGLGTLTVGVVLDEVTQIFGLKALPSNILFALGIVALILAVATYLSRRVTRTQRELEARVVEVETLSRRAIEQERRAAEEEAEKRILAAENDRKTRELEDARRMQLAMLPSAAPSHGRFNLAFRMATATEVGGDYVDVVPCGDGEVQVAVGDATSHGLQAGMVVAVAKSLFQTSRREPGPLAVLRRVAEGLEALRGRGASMALAVLRLDGASVRIASAGMPPLLVFRAATGATEEVLLPGMPLGTMHDATWEEREIRLGSGDAVLAMTDGLAESVDSAGVQYGYERAARLFSGLASRDAAGIADGMLAGAVSFLGGAGLQDDFTVLALKVR